MSQGVGPVQGGGLAHLDTLLQYQVRVAVLQKDAMNQVGEAAIRLIQAAASATTGQNLDIRA